MDTDDVGDTDVAPDTDTTDDTDTPPDTDPTDPGDALAIVSAVVRAPDSPAVFQAQQADVTTSVPSRVTATLTDAAGATRTIAFSALATTHALPLVGFPAGSSHTVVLCATDERAQEACTEPLPFTVDDGPPIAPTVALLGSDAGRFQPGWTLFPPFSAEGDGVVVVDDAGTVVWAYATPRDWKSVTVTPQGTITAIEGANLVEIDWLGNELRRFRPDDQPIGPGDIPMAVEDPHHELLPMADGSVYTLDSTLVMVPDYPVDYELSAFAETEVSDQLVRHVAADGTVLDTWSMLDTLDPNRISWSSLDPTFKGYADWGHANAIIVDEVDDSLVVSLRHQDTVVKFDRTTGAIRWILANHDGWDPVFAPYLLAPVGEPFTWPAHQHGPMALPDGGLVLFDNGNENHTTPYSENGWLPLFSRVVRYRVDEATMTVTQEWEWRHPEGLYSHALGNADVQPATATVLATFSYLAKEGGVPNVEIGRGKNSTRIVEVDPATDEIVWELSVYGDIAVSPNGWLVDRAIRVPSLYGTLATDTRAAP